MAARSKARVYGRARAAGIAFSNSAGGRGSVVNVACFQVERSLRRADPLSRGVLPSMVCLSDRAQQ